LAISWQSLVYSVHNSLLHLLSNFQNAITPQNIVENCNSALFNELWRTLFLAKSARTLTHFIFTMNVRNNYDHYHHHHYHHHHHHYVHKIKQYTSSQNANDKKSLKPISQLRFDYYTTTIRLRRKIDVFLLASNWKQVRAIRRSRIVVES